MKNDSAAVSYIENHTWSTTRLGLERTTELLFRLGNPQEKLKFVHVAGSNGKGSVCAMVASVLKESGYTTGLYTSPYLVEFNEQLKVNNIPISNEELEEIVDIVKPQADKMKDHPSRFELLTAVAMIYFLKRNCDVVVLEVGLGGKLDSTNVIPSALVSVITNIGMEHEEYLGHDLAQIAENKAGIIKKNTLCVCYDGNPIAVDVIKKRCSKLAVPVVKCEFNDINITHADVNGMYFNTDKIKDLFIPLIGIHQTYNAKVSLEVFDGLIKSGFDISEESIRKGLKKVTWPARFQILKKNPLFILDGGHNPQCIDALKSTIELIFPEKKFVFLIGVLADKDYTTMIDMMLPFCKECICVTPDSPRALYANDLARTIGNRVSAMVCNTVEEGINKALKLNDDVLAFGSLYMAGQILKANI